MTYNLLLDFDLQRDAVLVISQEENEKLEGKYYANNYYCT